MKILAIDPGNIESAYVLMDEDYKPIEFGKVLNEELLNRMDSVPIDTKFVIEMVASYGMGVGQTVFDTCVWIGRFWQKAENAEKTKLYRQEVKMNICHNTTAKDGNVIKALQDRFGERRSQKNPNGFFPPVKENKEKTGWADDVWQAYAVGVTYLDGVKNG